MSLYSKWPAVYALQKDGGIANSPQVLRSAILELARHINNEHEKIGKPTSVDVKRELATLHRAIDRIVELEAQVESGLMKPPEMIEPTTTFRGSIVTEVVVNACEHLWTETTAGKRCDKCGQTEDHPF